MDKPRQSRAGSRRYIAFRVADPSFCADIMTVREIRGWPAETRATQAAA